MKLLFFFIILFSVVSLNATNLIVNGNFESGAIGFYTNYTRGNIASAAQVYNIIYNPHDYTTGFASYGDHTTGSGLMMAVNAAAVANQIIWGQNVAVNANSTYTFSIFISSFTTPAPAQLKFLVNGASLGTFNASTTLGLWEEFSATFNTGSSTSIALEIIDLTCQSYGDDFALDDITLIAVPEPGTFLLSLVCVFGIFLKKRM